MGCHFPLRGIFPTQGSNLGLLHCRQILYCLSHQGSPREAPVSHKAKQSQYISSIGNHPRRAQPSQACQFSLLAPHHRPGPCSHCLHKYCPATFHFILTVPALHPHLEDHVTELEAFPRDRLSLLGLLSRPPLCPLSPCPGYLSRHVFVWKHCAHHY